MTCQALHWPIGSEDFSNDPKSFGPVIVTKVPDEDWQLREKNYVRRKQFMSRKAISVLGAAALLLTVALASNAQERRVVTVQNPDGSYTIVEYPIGRETPVTLTPVGFTGARGRATILRDPSGTRIRLSLTNLPADVTAMNIYAVEPTGAMTFLRPIYVINGVGTFTTTTPLSRFMLVASPEANLSAYNPRTRIYFRSSVPPGLTVIPLTGTVGEQVATVVKPNEYIAPMLGISEIRPGHKDKFRVNFSGAMEGSRADIFIKPRKHGASTEVLMHFHNLKDAPKGTAYILWAISPDNQYQRLGEIVNVRGRNEAEIRSETNFYDFGLLMTAEDLGITRGTIIRPSGHRVGVIEIVR